jgi:hypothetical protein
MLSLKYTLYYLNYFSLYEIKIPKNERDKLLFHLNSEHLFLDSCVQTDTHIWDISVQLIALNIANNKHANTV